MTGQGPALARRPTPLSGYRREAAGSHSSHASALCILIGMTREGRRRSESAWWAVLPLAVGALGSVLLSWAWGQPSYALASTDYSAPRSRDEPGLWTLSMGSGATVLGVVLTLMWRGFRRRVSILASVTAGTIFLVGSWFTASVAGFAISFS